jgi:monomeric sarcosine oxidase
VSRQNTYDVAVVGAGVFGAWTAYWLRQRGKKVFLLDAHGPANARASSGGESRIIRMGYGPDELYSRWAIRALQLWQEFFHGRGEKLFHRTGVLWIAGPGENYVQRSLEVLKRLHVPVEQLSHEELQRRYPQINFEGVEWGFLETHSGVLMARRAVHAVVEAALRNGVEYGTVRASAPSKADPNTISTRDDETVSAHSFVYCCGPWLPNLFPDVLGGRIFPSRQEVLFFGTPEGGSEFCSPAMPTWIDLGSETYGMPDLESRGFKIALDRHGPAFDPENGVRVVSPESVAAVRQRLAHRFPRLADAPVVETRVCQYENTSNGDFLIDRHPEFQNVWLVGGGSGHGFKHGPALGEYVSNLIVDGGESEKRFSLATKDRVQRRAVF